MDLHEAGYYVNWFGKNDLLSGDSSTDTREHNAFLSYINFWEGSAEDDIATFLTNNMQEPFFTYIPTIGAHPPYRPSDGGPDTATNNNNNNNDNTSGSSRPPSSPATRHTPVYGEQGFFSFWNNQTTSMYDPDEIKAKSPLR